MNDANTPYPKTRKLLAQIGLDEKRIPQDSPFDRDGYDEIALRPDGKIDYDKRDGSFTRVRKPWPAGLSATVIQELRDTYDAESRA